MHTTKFYYQKQAFCCVLHKVCSIIINPTITGEHLKELFSMHFVHNLNILLFYNKPVSCYTRTSEMSRNIFDIMLEYLSLSPRISFQS